MPGPAPPGQAKVATPTFSVATAAIDAGKSVGKVLVLPDTNCSGNACATPGGMLGTMRQGDVFLAKMADGSLAYYRFDPERWTQANPVIIRHY